MESQKKTNVGVRVRTVRGRSEAFGPAGPGHRLSLLDNLGANHECVIIRAKSEKRKASTRSRPAVLPRTSFYLLFWYFAHPPQ
jgi:hypothetical protein